MTDQLKTEKQVRKRAKRKQVVDWISNRLFRLALGIMLRLPWQARLQFASALAAHLIAPLAGWRRRIRDNLATIFPELSTSEIRRLEKEVPGNVGRTFVEIYSSDEFSARIKTEELTGPGVDALEKARAEGRPVLLVTGHIGNYDAMRAALIARGYPVGGLYKPMANRFFNAHYVRAMEQIGTPMFPKNRSGMGSMLKFLRKGGMLGIVIDQYVAHGAPLSFMDEPALTALSAAEIALKLDALVVPVYGIRRPDLGFDLIVSHEIPKGTPEEMTQALNDDLAEQVRAHPEQWIWMHRRWRPRPEGMA